MGMYTELIFGARLKADTPDSVIQSLRYMCGDITEKPADFPLPEGRCEWLFRGASAYFGVEDPVSRIWKLNYSGAWCISTRSNIKNYDGEIETFLDWVRPYVDRGSGNREMYAVVTYEEADAPTIYYADEA